MALVLEKPRKEEAKRKSSFYNYVRLTLFLCRCIGLLPVSGLRNATSDLTRGTLKAWYSAVYLPSVMIQGIGLHFFAYDLFEYHDNVEAVTKFVEFVVVLCNFFILLILMRISLRWKVIVKQIESIEKLLPSTSQQIYFAGAQCLSVAIFVLGAVESVLHYFFTWNIIELCFFRKGEMDVKSYFLVVFNWVFSYLPFNMVVAVVTAIVKLQIFIFWSCRDVIVIIISIYLTTKFTQFNHLITQKQNNISSRDAPSWATLQVHYTRISRLVMIIDDNINPLVLLSFFSNLLSAFEHIFYITNNLIKSDNPIGYTKCLKKSRHTAMATVYLSYTCIFVTLRTIVVSHYASNLHLTSRKPLDALHHFPSSAFNADMQRLMTQVYYSKINLTGCRLFRVTREMILAMMASLITYELVLFQF